MLPFNWGGFGGSDDVTSDVAESQDAFEQIRPFSSTGFRFITDAKWPFKSWEELQVTAGNNKGQPTNQQPINNKQQPTNQQPQQQQQQPTRGSNNKARICEKKHDVSHKPNLFCDFEKVKFSVVVVHVLGPTARP